MDKLYLLAQYKIHTNKTGRDSATADANYCGPGTQKIEIKITIKINE